MGCGGRLVGGGFGGSILCLLMGMILSSPPSGDLCFVFTSCRYNSFEFGALTFLPKSSLFAAALPLLAAPCVVLKPDRINSLFLLENKNIAPLNEKYE